jgi:hypothetical protein
MAFFHKTDTGSTLVRHILIALFIFPGVLVNHAKAETPRFMITDCSCPWNHTVNELVIPAASDKRLIRQTAFSLSCAVPVFLQTRMEQRQDLMAYNSRVLHEMKISGQRPLLLLSFFPFLQRKSIWHKCADEDPAG